MLGAAAGSIQHSQTPSKCGRARPGSAVDQRACHGAGRKYESRTLCNLAMAGSDMYCRLQCLQSRERPDRLIGKPPTHDATMRIANDPNTKKPALVPLLTMGNRHMRPGLYPPGASNMSPFLLSTINLIGFTLIAVFAIAALSPWDPLAYALSVIPVVALYVAFTLLTPHAGIPAQWLRSFDLAAAAWPLSLRLVLILATVLCRESYAIGFPSTNAIQTLILGSAKALTWYFLSQVVRVIFPTIR